MAPRGGGAVRLILNSYATSVREGEPEPTFSPPQIVVVEFKLDSDREGRPEVELGEGPKFLKIGSAVSYRSEDISAWLSSSPTGGEQIRARS